MSRLASFKGPSTPTSSPVQSKQPQVPASPSRITESPQQRKVRSILQDIRTTTESWNDIILINGLKSVRNLVDARTELDNELSSFPAGTLPQHHVVEPKLSIMEKCIAGLDSVVLKLKKQFQRLNTQVETLENLFYETHKTKGWHAVQQPLWTTWSLEKFASSVPDILNPYHRSLQMHIDIVDLLRSHSVSFEASRNAVSQWVSQPFLADNGWEAYWEDLCAVEIDRWNNK